MEIYFNGKEFKTMEGLQKAYQKWTAENEDEFFNLCIKEGKDIIFEHQFPRGDVNLSIFEHMHRYLTDELLSNLNSRSLIDDIETVDTLYLLYYNEIHIDSTLTIALDQESYCDYISNDERLIMAQRCAMFDIENDSPIQSLEELTQEYMDMDTSQLLEEYENRYDHDYHIAYLDNIAKSSDDANIQRIARKSSSEYRTLKEYTLKNNISMEMRRKNET